MSAATAHAATRRPRSEPVIVLGSRVCSLQPHRPHTVPGGARFRREGDRVAAFAPAGVMRRRGEPCQRATLDPGDAVVVGRAPVLVARTGVSRRYPAAVEWRGLLVRSPESLLALGELALAAAADAALWISGESGTGKDLAARAAHASSPRAAGPFVALNCAALPEGIADAELFGATRGAYTGADRDRPGAFRQADGGTLFLDEVGELPLSVQAKLLRVLETGRVRAVGGPRSTPVDVRVIVATWQDLMNAVGEGRFRFDLLQRLWVLHVDLPPLRSRPADIAPLLEAFLAAHDADDLWPHPSLLRRLELAEWRGNVRELRNCATRAAVSGDLDKLLPAARFRPTGGRMRRGTLPPAIALARIRTALDRADGNRTAAARELGISRSTLYRWLQFG